MSDSLSYRFFHSLRWTFSEAIPYQLLLAVHQAALCVHVSSTIYGFTSSLFSLLYLVITIGNAGFDASVPAVSNEGFASRRHFRQTFLIGYIPTFLALLGSALVLPWLVRWYTVTTLGSQISSSLMMSMSMLIILEGIRKSLRVLLHTAFYNKQTALAELAHIGTYLSFVWGSYGVGIALDDTVLFGALVIASLISTGMLAADVLKFYHGLVPDAPAVAVRPWRSLIHVRAGTSVLVISHQLFSSNFLVPLCGYSLSFHEAGAVKLLCSVIHGATVCIRKIFGATSEALFARAKQSGLAAQQQAFRLVTSWLYTIIGGLLTLSTLLLGWLALTHTTTTLSSVYWYAGILLFLQLSEQFFTVYETLFIIEGRINSLVVFTLTTLCLLASILHAARHLSLWHVLLLILCIRLVSFICISFLSFCWWRIAPPVSFRPFHFVSIVCVVLGILFWC